jgi:hypothetical protein
MSPRKIWSEDDFSDPNERWAMVQTVHFANERVPRSARVAPKHVPGNGRDGAVPSEKSFSPYDRKNSEP